MWYKITGTIAIILIVILLILLFRFLKGTGNDKKRRNLLKYIILLFLLLVLDIPFVINESYKFGKWYSTVWGGEDVLQYFGAVLSFLGTVVLGAIAVWQNNRANEVNRSIMEMTRREKIAYLTPKNTLLNSSRNIEIDFINKGNSFGIIKFITLKNGKDIILQKSAEGFVDGEKEYKLTTDIETPKDNRNFRMTVEFLIQNPFGYEYVEEVIMDFIPEQRHSATLFDMKTFNIAFRNEKEVL